MDAIGKATSTTKKARQVGAGRLRDFFEEGYGIFSGRAKETAVLRFSAASARWVAKEVWHPRQQGEFDAEGRYVLKVPYSMDTEILMDVLRHGPEVEVLEPASLRDRVRERLKQARAIYRG